MFWLSRRERCVARSRQVCIYVVEVLLVAIYLPEGKDVYMYIRPAQLNLYELASSNRNAAYSQHRSIATKHNQSDLAELAAAPMAIQHTFDRIFKPNAFLSLTVSVSRAHLGIRL
jgi:hypothetical protein